jgi:hypothetical protein
MWRQRNASQPPRNILLALYIVFCKFLSYLRSHHTSIRYHHAPVSIRDWSHTSSVAYIYASNSAQYSRRQQSGLLLPIYSGFSDYKKIHIAIVRAWLPAESVQNPPRCYIHSIVDTAVSSTGINC